MEQAQRKWSVTKCWLKEIKCSMERLLANENTGAIALEKSLEKYNKFKTQGREEQQHVLELVEIDELAAMVNTFHMFEEEMDDTAVKIEEMLQAKRSRGTLHSEVQPEDSAS